MKRTFFSLLMVAILLSACAKNNTNVVIETTEAAKADDKVSSELVETTKGTTTNEVIESVNHMTEREFSFDPDNKFRYTGDDQYLKVITDEMVNIGEKNFGGQGAVVIPTPYIAKVDDSDKDDIKVYGDFYINGYTMNGTIFMFKCGGSYPGCYHLKEEDGKVVYLNQEIAEDGSRFDSSLRRICGNDESLVKAILAVKDGDFDKTRIEYVEMYAKEKGLRVSGIKDYGWPIILFNNISDAEFLYNFYSSYFSEIREEDYLNDLEERLMRLKEKYITKDALADIDKKTSEVGADMIISAQDVTDEMEDTLQVDDLGNGNLKVSFSIGDNIVTVIDVKLGEVNGNKMITKISVE
ncbi:MAG: hypothetical protein IJ593_07990 [Lachnospiraceae bacterium]|nr:hypothetical protein [Lachnospiraceae bacterium]